jgi:hypothetical protein
MFVAGAALALLYGTTKSQAGYLPEYLAIGVTWILSMTLIIGVMDRFGLGPSRDNIWGWMSFGLFWAGGLCWVYWSGPNPYSDEFIGHPWWIAAGLQIVSGIVYGTYYLLRKRRQTQ